MSDKRLTHDARRITPYLLIFSAFVVRLHGLAFQSLWRDEVDAICFAQAPLLPQLAQTALHFTPSCPPDIPDLLAAFTQPGFNGPLYFLALRGWISVAGYGEFALRFSSLLCGVVSVALIITLGTRLFNRAIGLMAGALLALSAYQVWYSQEAKMYTVITLLTLASIYFLRRGVEEGRLRFWIGVVACTSLAMGAHILAALLIPVEVALFLVWWPYSRRHLVAGAVTLACMTLPYLPVGVDRLKWVFEPADTGFTRYPLPQMFTILNGAYAGGILADLIGPGLSIAGALLALTALLGLASVNTPARPARSSTAWTRFKSETRSDRVLSRLGLALWIGLPPLAIALVSINRPIFTDRYLIWIQPAYYLAAALGIWALWRWWKPIAVMVLSVLLIVNSAGIWQQSRTPFKPDFRSAAAVFAAQHQPDDLTIFQIPYIRHNFTYYFRDPIQSLDGPYFNYRGNFDGYQDSDETVLQWLDTWLGGQHTIWVIWSEEVWADERHLLRRWLETHSTITFHTEFPQVQIVRYELK
jgi:hypothetical protein